MERAARLSPLQIDINRILRMTAVGMAPLAVLLIGALVIRREPLVNGAHTVVAALVPLVPEGLVLLTSLTFAVAAVRLARLGALAQRLNAVESLASVDVVCVDKTGTLTENRLAVVAVQPAEDATEDSVRDVLGAFAASVGERNATMQAIHDALSGVPRDLIAEVPFSSARKWSGVTMPEFGSVVIGAPDVLERHGVTLDQQIRRHVAEHAEHRRRVLLVATGDVGSPTTHRCRRCGLRVWLRSARDSAVTQSTPCGFCASRGSRSR